MKTILFTCLFLFLSVIAFSQNQNTNCPEIGFTYDASGNRIQRYYVIVNCDNNNNNNDTPHRHINSDSNSITKVYPNPTTSTINIDITLSESACSEPSLIYLFDANGQPVFSKSTSSRNIELNISSLSQGTYVVKVICCNYQNSTVVIKTNNGESIQSPKQVIEVIK